MKFTKENMTGFVREQMLASARIADKVHRLVVDESESVGQGLLAAAIAYAILAKSSPQEVPADHLHEILDAAYQLVSDADREESGHALQ